MARYRQDHVDRLRLIAHLQTKGLSLAAIGDLFEETRHGSAADWLDLGEVLDHPWSEDPPRPVTEAELSALLADLDDPARTRSLLEHEAIIERRSAGSDGDWLVLSPALLDVTLAWVRLGLAPETVRELGAIIRRNLASMADEVVDRFTAVVSMRTLDTHGPGALATLLTQSRGLTDRSIRVLAAQEMLRATRAAARAGRQIAASDAG